VFLKISGTLFYGDFERFRLCRKRKYKDAMCVFSQLSWGNKIIINNPSCYLPKEIDAASEHEKCNFDFKPFGSDGMNRFW